MKHEPMRPSRRAAATLARVATLAALAGAALPFAAASELAESCAGKALETGMLAVRYKPLTEATQLVDQLLSPCGSYKVPKALGKIIVEDESARVAEIEAALASWDLPPQRVEISVSLVRGERGERPGGTARLEGLRELHDTLDSYVRYSSFEPLGSAVVRVKEGGEALLDLGGGYQVELSVVTVDRDRGIVQVEPFTLQKLPKSAAEGGVGSGPQVPLPVLRNMGLDLPEAKLRIIGASGREKDKALFLMIKATVVDEDREERLAERIGRAVEESALPPDGER